MGGPSKPGGLGTARKGPEPLRRPLLISAGAHALLVTVIFAGALLGHRGPGWGEGGAGGVATVRLVSAASVPLPSPAVATDNRLATENPGLHRPDPVPPAPRRRSPGPGTPLRNPKRATKSPSGKEDPRKVPTEFSPRIPGRAGSTFRAAPEILPAGLDGTSRPSGTASAATG